MIPLLLSCSADSFLGWLLIYGLMKPMVLDRLIIDGLIIAGSIPDDLIIYLLI